jgi:hypothetical protein
MHNAVANTLLQLIWMKLESDYGQGQYDLAENWCRLALHKIFSNCGPANTSKLERYMPHWLPL